MASLYEADGQRLTAVSVGYETFYPQASWHAQRPADWRSRLVAATHQLLDRACAVATQTSASTAIYPINAGTYDLVGSGIFRIITGGGIDAEAVFVDELATVVPSRGNRPGRRPGHHGSGDSQATGGCGKPRQ